MAKRKPSSVKQYVSATGYKPSKQTVAKFQKAITNYNARIRRKSKSLGEFSDILPATTTLDNEINKMTSIKDVNSRIRELERLKGEGLDVVSLPSGEAITQGELANIEERLKAENRYRKEREKLKAGIEEEQGRFRVQAEEENKPVEIKDSDTLERLRAKSSRWDNYNRALQAMRWKSTYIGKIDMAITEATIAGLPDETLNNLELLKDIIEQMDSVTLTTLAAYAPTMDIHKVSDIPLLIQQVDSLLDDWMDFMEEYDIEY